MYNKTKQDYNQDMTKTEQLKRVWKIEQKDCIVLEGNKQRINISIHAGLWNEIPDQINKSALVQKLLKDFLEKDLKQRIILTKAQI